MEVCTYVSASASVVGCVGIISTFCIPRLRSRESRAMKLLLFLSIADFFEAALIMLPSSPAVLCKIAGIGGSVAVVSSFLWSAGIAVYIYYRIRGTSMHCVTVLLHLVCWGVPLFIGVYLLAADVEFTPSNQRWCFIADRYGTLRMVLVYGPMWLCLALIILTYFKIYRVGAQFDATQTVKRLALIPVVMVISRLPGSINRVWELASTNDGGSQSLSPVLDVLQAFLDPAQGALNFLLFSPGIFRSCSRVLCRNFPSMCFQDSKEPNTCRTLSSESLRTSDLQEYSVLDSKSETPADPELLAVQRGANASVESYSTRYNSVDVASY